MLRNEFSGLIVGLAFCLAACGGGSAAVHGGGDVTGGDASGKAAEANAALAARRAYSNPGGMWLPLQMKLPEHVANFQKMGVAMGAERLSDLLADPLAAVVSLGGCTGSFVSPKGLLVTNHHCVQGALQFNATPENNLVENGFLAKTLSEEKPAGPAQLVSVAQAMRDVTHEMRDGLEGIADPAARKEESERRQKTLTAACEKDRPGIRCDVKAFFKGGLYQLIEYLEIRDVRLVYVPKRSVGNYGGEIDNWAWPRHTGDFSFYRAYVGKDGKPAAYSADNVPFESKHYLRVSSAGMKPGDFAMVTGYPGMTNRVDTARKVHHDVEWYYPYLIAYLKQSYAIAESHLADAGETGIKAGVAKQRVQNGLEKYEGVLAGMTKGDLLARKDAIDAATRAWANEPGREAYKAAIARFDAILEEDLRTARVTFDRGMAFGGSRLLGAALLLTRFADERTKPDAERKPGFQERDMARTEGAQKQFARAYDRTLDRASFELVLTRALDLPAADRPWLATLLGVNAKANVDAALIKKTLDAWYKKPLIEDEALRLSLLKTGTLKQLKASKDPFVAAAQRVFPLVKAQEKKDDVKTGELLLVAPMYVEAMRQSLGGFLSPDANSTLRITYGTVKAFKPESAAESDWAFTVAKQIPAKNTGKNPFDAPAPVLEAIAKQGYGPYADASLGGELPVDFLTDLDITGGNSGSPTLNDKGELVGLAFDGTIEGVSSDVVFDGSITRTIHVDARYMLWMMDAIDGADHLVTEMGITPSL
jgi:hypothetical protein